VSQFKDPLNACLVCGKPDSEKPMSFKGEDWCCEIHRKVIVEASSKKEYPIEFAAMTDGVALRVMSKSSHDLLPIEEDGEAFSFRSSSRKRHQAAAERISAARRKKKKEDFA
jgi:hypothetical protein